MDKKLSALLEKIEKNREANVYSMEDLILDKGKASIIKTHICGLYWIYTNYPKLKLKTLAQSTHENAVKINHLAHIHENWPNICGIKLGNFKLVYNGIAGTESDGSHGIRERVLQHFGNGSSGTGCLAIGNTGMNDGKKWKFSYVELTQDEYMTYSQDLERLWRLKYGWPTLCSR